MSDEKEVKPEAAETEVETEVETEAVVDAATEEEPIAEEHEHTPPKQRSGGTGTFLAILLALGALGGIYYLWQLQLAANDRAAVLENELKQLSTTIQQRHQEVMARLNTVPEHQHPKLEQRIGHMESVVFDLRSRLGQERRGWLVSEVEYLLRIAENRLTLERDTATAIAALQSAIGRLQALNDPNFSVVIDQLHADIAKLSSVQLPDRSALASNLADLSARVENLPLATTAVRSGPTDQDTANTSVWQKMWHDFLGLVTIRRDTEVGSPMLVPEERYFLKQNLKLKLETARLALLADNPGAWKAALLESTGWLQRYFDVDTETVRSAIALLQRLADVNLRPDLPQLGDTRRLLQQAAMQQALMPIQSAPAAPQVTQPAPEPVKPQTASTTAAEEKPVAAKPATAKPEPAPAAGSETAPGTKDATGEAAQGAAQ